MFFSALRRPWSQWTLATTLALFFCSTIATSGQPPEGIQVRSDAESQSPAELTAVWLTAQEPSTDHADCWGELLTRKLVRQGVLIAARDWLRMSTHDVVLRKALPHDDAEARRSGLSVLTHGTADAKLKVKVWRTSGADVQDMETLKPRGGSPSNSPTSTVREIRRQCLVTSLSFTC